MTFNRFSSHRSLFKCPFQDKYRYCPLDKLRKLSVEERITHIKKLTLQQFNNLELHFNKCLLESRKMRKEKSLNK